MRTCVVFAAVAMSCGCAQLNALKFPADAEWPGAEVLGSVAVSQGGHWSKSDQAGTGWPLSLGAPPGDYTYRSALREKAAAVYSVSEKEVVLGEIAVDLVAEIVGTVRAWRARSKAARR